MTHAKLTPGMVFADDTLYSADGGTIHMEEGECVPLTNPSYFGIMEEPGGCLRTAFLLKGLRDTILDFGGARLVLHGRIQPFVIDGCENVEIRGVTVEYERSFVTELRVAGRRDGELLLKKLPAFPCRVENGSLIPFGRHWENRGLHRGGMFVQAFDTETGEGRGLLVAVIGSSFEHTATPPAFVREFSVSEKGERILLRGDIPPSWDESVTVALAHEPRDISTVQIRDSRGVTVRDCRILNGAGMGIFAVNSEDLTLEGLRLTRDETSHGIVTNAADAVHLVACRGKIRIADSVFEGMIDDALNVHSVFLGVEEACGNRLTLFRHRECHFLNTLCGFVRAGDLLAVHKGCTLKEIARVSAQDAGIPDPHRLTVRTAEALPAIREDDLCENLTAQPELTIENCSFGKANSHLRIQTRGRSEIRNCRIALPLMLTGDTNYWRECSPCRDLTIRDCSFTGGRGIVLVTPEGFEPTKSEPYYHGNVRVLDNTFEAEEVLNARYAGKIEFRGNRRAGSDDLPVPLRLRLFRSAAPETDGRCAVSEE